MKHLLLALLACAPLFASGTFTSVQTGNWNDPTTWGFASGAPVCHTNIPCMTDSGDAGDKVVIGNLSHVVTCPVAVTCSAGTSPSTDDVSNPAITATATNTTASLVINGTLIYAGSVLMNSASWTVGAGATIQYDSSWSSAPIAALYTWSTNNTVSGSGVGGRLVLNGTSGSHVTWHGAGNSAANATCNSFACRSGRVGASSVNGFADAGTMTATYTDFSYLGGLGDTTIYSGIYLAVKVSTSTLTNCTYTKSNTFYIKEGNGSGGLTIDALQLTSTVNATAAGKAGSGAMQIATGPSTGTRTIKNSVIQGNIQPLSASSTTFTFKNLVLDVANRVPVAPIVDPSVGLKKADVTINTDQILAYNNITTGGTAATGDLGIGTPGGTHTNWYYLRYAYPTLTNSHNIVTNETGYGTTLDGWVVDGHTNGVVWFSPGPAVAGAVRPFVLKNSIAPCREDGKENASFAIFVYGSTASTTYDFYNNTWCSTQSKTGIGWEVVRVVAGSIPTVVNNLAYREDALGIVRILCSPAAQPADAGTVLLAGYNAIFNSSDSNGYCSAATSSGQVTTGPTNDLYFSRPPVWKAGRRRLHSFDVAYLGYSLSSTAWSAGQTYSVGQVVSDSQSAVYSGDSINWRLISNSGSCATSSTSTNRPFTGSIWVDCWEPAVLEYIRAATLAGTTYAADAAIGAPAGLNMIGVLNYWVRDGFHPTEPTLLTAGYGGTYIGAMQPLSGSGGSNPNYRDIGSTRSIGSVR